MSSGWGSSDILTRRVTELERQLRAVKAILEGGSGGPVAAASDVSFSPAGNISATNVQAALAELDSEKAPVSHTHTKSQITDFAHTHTIADLPVATSGTSSTTQLVRADDTRLSNARTPTTHSHLITDLPVATSGTSSSTQLVRADDSRLSDARTPTAHTHTASEVTDFAEAVDDRVGALLTAGANISLSYNDVTNTLTISATTGGGAFSGSFTMTSGTSTTVSDSNITTSSKIFFAPATADAFSIDGAITGLGVSAGSFTVVHAAATGLTRTYNYYVVP